MSCERQEGGEGTAERKPMTRPSLSRVFAALQLGIARKKMPFYAVARGHKPGIYQTW